MQYTPIIRWCKGASGLMIFWNILVVTLMAGLGALLWYHTDNPSWKDWLIKFVITGALIFGPYFFWDEIAAYWESSSSGPINIETGWW